MNYSLKRNVTEEQYVAAKAFREAIVKELEIMERGVLHNLLQEDKYVGAWDCFLADQLGSLRVVNKLKAMIKE